MNLKEVNLKHFLNTGMQILYGRMRVWVGIYFCIYLCLYLYACIYLLVDLRVSGLSDRVLT